jgi:hypothetical protein
MRLIIKIQIYFFLACCDGGVNTIHGGSCASAQLRLTVTVSTIRLQFKMTIVPSSEKL